MNITLIGASGFVGTRLIQILSKTKDYSLKNIDLLPSQFYNELTVIGDVRNQEQRDSQLAGTDVVVLLAAQHRDDVTPISLYYDTNVEGMKVTLKAMDGKTVTTDTLSNNGKPIIIDFFATWCKPCNRELNAINEVYEDWVEETGVKLIAISIDKAQDINKVKPMVDGYGWTYDVLLDPNSDLRRALGIQMIPYTLIVDGTGKVVYRLFFP